MCKTARKIALVRPERVLSSEFQEKNLYDRHLSPILSLFSSRQCFIITVMSIAKIYNFSTRFFPSTAPSPALVCQTHGTQFVCACVCFVKREFHILNLE